MIKTISYGFRSAYMAYKAAGLLVIAIITGLLYEGTFYPLIQIYCLSKILDLFSKHSASLTNSLTWIAFFYIIATIFFLASRTLRDVTDVYVQEKLGAYIDWETSQKLTELDPATFENPVFQNLLSQIDGVKGTIQTHLIRFTSFLNAIFKFITAAVVLSFTFPIFTPIILIATLPAYFAWAEFRKKLWPYYVEKRTPMVRMTQYIKTLLSNDSTSKEAAIFKTGSVLLNKETKEQKLYFRSFAKANNPWNIYIFLTRLVQFIAFIYTQYLSLARVISGTLGIGQFALIFQQTLNLTLSAEDILNLYSSVESRNKYVDKYFDFLHYKRYISSPSESMAIPQEPAPAVIEFKNVSFKYPKTEKWVLKNFNLTIKSGEKVAFVGENGAGKTTIIKLLLRFYDVTEGDLQINGVNIKNVSLDDWYRSVGALFQDFIKYQFTFKENVYFGDLAKAREENLFKAAIEKSGADQFVKELEHQYEQQLGKMFDGGIDLSGGQWQKLALARAFFRNAPILILDEPTSAIDAKAEYEIFERVQNLQKDKTVIIISHRFSTVRNADRILVLDNGKIIEEGNHDVLMKKNGLYAELFNIQAQGYK